MKSEVRKRIQDSGFRELMRGEQGMIVVEFMTALNMALKMSTEIAARERRTIEAQKDFICNLEAKSFYVDDPEISGQQTAGSRQPAAESGKLRACPFCGGDAELYKNIFASNPECHHYVLCNECLARTCYYGSEAEAAKAWNHRADDHFRDAAEKGKSGQMPAAGGQTEGTE